MEIPQGEDPESIFLPAGGYDRSRQQAPCQYPAGLSDTAFLSGAGAEYICARKGKPWFVSLNCLRPHPPMVAPEPYNRMFDPARLSLPPRAGTPDDTAASHPFLAASLKAYGARRYFRADLAPEDVTAADERNMRASYYGNMAEVDARFGALEADLKAAGQWNDTLVIFTSDHADQLGGNWIYGRRGPFPGMFHIPLMIRDPRFPAQHGTSVEDFTESIDILPTITEALGQPQPECDGSPLRGFLSGEAPADWRRLAVWETDFRELRLTPEVAPYLPEQPDDCCFTALRAQDWLYIHFPA